MKIPDRIKSVLKKIEKINKKQIKATVLVTSSVIFILGYINIKSKTKYIENKPAQIVKSINDEGEEELFLERVETMRSGIMKIGKIVFGEEKLVLSETFGTSSSNYVEVSGEFRVDYAIDIDDIITITDEKKMDVVYKIKPTDIEINSVTLINDIEETFEFKSFGTKIIDLLPGLNKDEDIKENAIKQLLRNSKTEAEKFDNEKLKEDAEEVILNLINKLNICEELNYRIEFIE